MSKLRSQEVATARIMAQKIIFVLIAMLVISEPGAQARRSVLQASPAPSPAPSGWESLLAQGAQWIGKQVETVVNATNLTSILPPASNTTTTPLGQTINSTLAGLGQALTTAASTFIPGLHMNSTRANGTLNTTSTTTPVPGAASAVTGTDKTSNGAVADSHLTQLAATGLSAAAAIALILMA